MACSDQRRGRTRNANAVGVPASRRTYNHSLLLLDSDETEAFRLNQVAAKDGMHDAVLAMGWFYLNGVGVEIDEQAALRWYKKSARQGDARAMFSLGQTAYSWHDYSDALLWFTRAAAKGHRRSDFWIGKLYWRGQGVTEDRGEADKHFTRAASKKLPEAQRTLRYIAFLARHTPSGH